jgi:hypothetical protein
MCWLRWHQVSMVKGVSSWYKILFLIIEHSRFLGQAWRHSTSVELNACLPAWNLCVPLLADQEENQVNGGLQETAHLAAMSRFLTEVLPSRAALLADGSVRVAGGNTRDFGREVGRAPSPGPGPNG